MPRGTIYTASDRATSKYDIALKKKSKDLPAARDKAMKEVKKKTPPILFNGKGLTKRPK